MLSRTLGIMFDLKQLFTKNYRLLHNTVILVHFNSYAVIRSRSLKVSKNYQNNEVSSIKKLLGVLNSFSRCYEITLSYI